MTTTKLKELGSIKDMDGNDYSVFGHAQYNFNNEELTVTDIKLEYSQDGLMLREIDINSFAEMPDRFTESAITRLKEDIEQEFINQRMDYLSDIHRDGESNE